MVTPEIFRISQMLKPLLGIQDSQEEEIDNYNPAQRMSQLYTPEHQMGDRLTAMIDSMPQRQNPGIGRKILASIAGLTGDPNRVEHTLYGDYNRQLGDWKEKLGPTLQGANFERASNINERSLANQVISQEQRDRSLDRQTKRDKTLETQGNEKIAQSDKRISQADERIKISEAAAKGGTIDWGSNTIVYKDGTTAPIKADLFTTQEKMELQQKYAKERIEKQGENAVGNRDRVKTEVIDDPNNPGKKIVVSINLDTNKATRVKLDDEDVTPVGRGDESETQKAKGRLERARKIKLSNPRLSPYITIKGQDFTITPPRTFFPGGISKEEYEKAYNDIYGEAPTGTPQIPTEGARIKVKRKNPQTGKEETGSIPASQREQAIKAGYQVIQ